MWWTSWTFRRSSRSMKRKIEATTVSPANDDQDSGVWLLRGSVFLSPDSEAPGGRCGFPRIGRRQSARFPHHIGFSETSFESAGRTVPAGATAGVRDGSAEVGTSGFGWEQSKSQREQTQGHELWTDGGDREAAEGGSARVVEASRSRG